MITTGVIFCTKCGSNLVDVIGWEGPGRAVIECCECSNTTILHGFTLGRTRIPPDKFFNAADDVAVYRRDPQILNKIKRKAQVMIKCDLQTEGDVI